MHMEQIVLHLPDDPAECGQITAKDGILVHAPQRMGESMRLLQYLQEQRAVDRVTAESASIPARERHKARSVGALIPFNSWCCCSSRKLSRIALRLGSNSWYCALPATRARHTKRSLTISGAAFHAKTVPPRYSAAPGY